MCQSERVGADDQGRDGESRVVGGGYSRSMIRMLFDVVQTCVVEIVLLLPKVSYEWSISFGWDNNVQCASQ